MRCHPVGPWPILIFFLPVYYSTLKLRRPKSGKTRIVCRCWVVFFPFFTYYFLWLDGAFWYGQGTRWLVSQVLLFYFHLLGGAWSQFGRFLSLMFPSGWAIPVKGFIGW